MGGLRGVFGRGALDTRLWNLAALGAAACGPSVEVPAHGDSDGAMLCDIDEACGEGMICEERRCVPGEREDEGPYDYDGCEHEMDCNEYPMQCIDDGDCGVAELCFHGVDEMNHNECDALPTIGACGSSIPLIPIAVQGDESVVQLRFVEVDGDGAAELATVRTSGVDIVHADGSPVRAVDRAGVVDVTSGDFDRDGIRDLVVASDAAVTLLAGSETGAFTETSRDESVGSPRRVVSLVWSIATGQDDIAVLNAGGEVIVLEGPSLAGVRTTLEVEPLVDIAIGDFADVQEPGGATDGIAGASDDGIWIAQFGPSGYHRLDSRHVRDGVVSGRFADPSRTMVVAHTIMPAAWLLLEVAEGGRSSTQALVLAPIALEAGDVDGDADDDLVLVGDAGVTIAIAAETEDELFRCYQTTPEHVGSLLAVGDMNGDGIAEIAVSDGKRVTLLSTR